MPGSNRKQLGVKCAISGGAVGVIVARALWPNVVKIDAITFALLMVAILPWLSSVIKSIEFPGGIKLELRYLQEAAEKVITATPLAKPNARGRISGGDLGTPTTRYSFVDVMGRDPNLALAGLRIEIERRLRMLAEKYELQARDPLGRLLGALHRRQILTSDEASGLNALIDAGNSAVHGADVAPQVADWAIHTGPEVLAVLDAKLENGEPYETATQPG